MLAKIVGDAKDTIRPLLCPEPIKIYELVEQVVNSLEFSWSQDPYVCLYQKLFVTQAALCGLFYEFEVCDQRLVLTTVDVKLVNAAGSGNSATDISNDAQYLPNFDFYQDDSNFYDVTSEQVKVLLEKFWIQYDAYMSEDPALSVLGLAKGASWEDIQQRYRMLVSEAHPDKGGDSQRFIEIRRAYESLMRTKGYT